MLLVLGRRLGGAVPVLLSLILVVFILQKISPVDPVAALVGAKASPAVYAAARHKLGLDKPVPVQFFDYVGRALSGNLGESSVTRTPVSQNLRTYLPVTLELIVAAFFLIVVIGFFLGIATAQGWTGSGILKFIMVAGASVPVFLACLLGMLVFFRWLNLLPITGQTSSYNAPAGPTGFLAIDSWIAGRPGLFADDIRHLILPALCVAITPAVAVGRVLRSSLEGVMKSDYMRTARAKGLTERTVLIRHGLRNALGPVLALMGLQLAGLIGSSIVVEMIFARPGIGLYISQAITAGDFNTIAGVTLVVGLLYVVANVAVDMLQAIADPRVAM
jgi:peptide/nickel transport system permease protein